jgi:MraZ protein
MIGKKQIKRIKLLTKWQKMGESGEKWEIYIIFTKLVKNPGMITFIGEYSCKMDDKGRIMLPTAFKKQLPQDEQDRFVIKPDVFEKCLVLYPVREWEKLDKMIRSRTNPFNPEHARFLRMFYHGSAEITLDASNRMLIPKRLIEYGGMGREAILAGQSGKIEIWASERYESVSRAPSDFALMAEKILGGTFIDPGS